MRMLWDSMTTKQKLKCFEGKILGHLDQVCQAFDLEEVLSLATNPDERRLAWNAAMNLVEQGRVHLIQIKNEETSALMWVILGYPGKILSNKTFQEPKAVSS